MERGVVGMDGWRVSSLARGEWMDSQIDKVSR